MKNNVSLADQIFEKLQNDILNGKIARGSAITENQIAENLGISRTPVREAFKMLERERLIQDNGKGMTVIGISDEDMEDAYYIRETLEGKAAELAARNITDEQLKKLQEIIEFQEFYVNKNKSDKISIADTDFHEVIYDASGSVILRDALMNVHRKIQKYRSASLSRSDSAKVSFDEHIAILEALKKRDPKAVKKAMGVHTKNAHERIRRAICR